MIHRENHPNIILRFVKRFRIIDISQRDCNYIRNWRMICKVEKSHVKSTDTIVKSNQNQNALLLLCGDTGVTGHGEGEEKWALPGTGT